MCQGIIARKDLQKNDDTIDSSKDCMRFYQSIILL